MHLLLKFCVSHMLQSKSLSWSMFNQYDLEAIPVSCLQWKPLICLSVTGLSIPVGPLGDCQIWFWFKHRCTVIGDLGILIFSISEKCCLLVMPIRVSRRGRIIHKFICFGYELQMITILPYLFYRGYQYCFHNILFCLALTPKWWSGR